ncbi:hypothetical protein J4206_06045 [Candidatus Woesearchaeota archaeon]|nr:hypothetical protein [Candidatus Woesearchaeota archaeon]
MTADNAPAEWQADDVNVVLTPLDIYSGVALTKYCMDTDNACTPSMERISLSVACPQDTICNRYLRYYSADNVGNKEEIKSTSVIKIDKENPVTELTLGTPKYISGKNYVTSNTQITLTADEGQGSGAAKTEYKVNLDGAWIEYIGPFTLKNEGLNTVYYRTIDNVRNVETTKSIEIIVDNTPPELKLTGLTENPTLDDPSYSFAIETEADATVTVNGEMLSLVEGKANYSVNITEGVNTFNVISKDPVENPTAKGITRLVDTDIMPDFYETDALGTHPLYNDSDSSRTADNEAENGITDDREDFDRDGLTNYAEYMLGSNPLSSDSDSDSLTDTYEALISKTNIIKYDSDENGLSDGNEDFDNDGLTNYNEQEFGSNPYMRDTDADGLTDKEEKLLGTDPLSTDTDKDGLNDKSEVELKGNPLNGDSDGDGVIDGSDIYEQAFVNETVKAEMTIDGIGDLSETTEIKKEDAPYVPVTSLSGISSEIIDFSTTSNFTEATIKIYYDEAKLEGSENQLKIYYFDENDGVPVAAPIQGINTNDNYAWAKTNHLSSWFIADPSGWEAQSNIAWNRADEVYSDEETIRVKARIHNSQPVPAYNLKVNFYEGNPGSGGKLIGTDTIDVPGNGVEIASVEWFVDADSDNVYVKVDPEGSTREIRENNNEAYREFTKEKDSDGDGLSDYEETNGMRVRYPYKFITTDPTNPDSDGDGLSDGEEMGAPVNNYYVPISYPTLADSDNDGLDDYEEKEGWYVNTIKNIDKLATVLQKLENDEDYVSLIEEYHVTSNPLRADTDKDGLSDLKEQEIGSSPRTFDTDSDKLKDSIDDDPTVVENTPPDVTIISMKTEDTGILSITGLVKYNVGDNVEVATITLKMDGNTVTSHFSEGMYEDGFTYNWLSTKAFGIDVNIVAKDVNNNEKKLPVIYEQGIIISFIQAIENTFKGLTIGSAGFGSGFAHGAVMEISDTVEFVGSIVKGDGIQVMEDAGRGIEQLGQQGPGIILEAFEYRIQETGIRKSSAEFFGIREGTSDYGLFTGAWNIGFATGYIATAVGEGILLSKGAGAAASIVKGLAKSGQLAGVASKLSKAGKILKTAASTSMKTRLLIGGSLVGGTYLLKEAFPDIDPLERLYYTNLGAASTFMFMGHGKKIHPLTALTEAEQSNLLRFAGVSMGERTASLRVNFLNKLDDVTRKKFANPNLKTKFMEDILGAVETHNLPNERIGRQIQGALDFDGVPNFEQKLRGTRKSLGNVWEIEGGSKLKERGFTIKHFEEEFLLTNGKKWPGDVSTLSPQGKKILHEMKGLDWDAADSLRQADEVKRILKQNNYMKDIKASGQIDNYIFELRTNPPKYIQDTLDLKGVPWEVLQ